MIKKKVHALASVPSWMILGAVAILLTVVLVLAVRNINREKHHMAEILSGKGAVLIRAFESGTRTGMMGMMWGQSQLQSLLEETARQPGILYLVVTDRNGTILAADDRARIGRQFLDRASMQALQVKASESWRLTDDGRGGQAFEVYRFFRPLAGCDPSVRERACHRRHGSRPEMGWTKSCCGGGETGAGSRRGHEPIIFVGLDVAPFEAARREDIRNTVILSLVLVVLGFGGFLSLFWLQGYRATRKLLEDTRALATEVVTSLPDGLIVTDPHGRIAFVNEAAEGITGRGLESVRGEPLDELFPRDWKAVRQALDTEGPVLEKEISCSFGKGGSIPLSLSATRIVTEEGSFVGYLVIFRDLTEIRNLQEEVKRQEKLAALGSMAAGIAHEIRNPLSSIKGLATLFSGKFEDGSAEQEAAQVMLREVGRLNRVISELLEFARPSDLRPVPVDINELLDHSVRLVRQDAETRGIRIRQAKEPGIPPVRLDPDRFSQALLNLYLNAIQAMEDGGTLSIRSVLPGDGQVLVEVSDTGSGILPEDVKKVFDPYFTTKPSGTGLGLAIVHKIVEAHHGKVRIESTPGKGTTFCLFIPLDTGEVMERGHHAA